MVNDHNVTLTYKGQTLVSINDIPDVFFDKTTKKKYYKELYDHCTKQLCIAEFICITEIDELKKYHGDYEKFMTMFDEICIKRIQIVDGAGPRSKNSTRDEDRPVNLEDRDHRKALKGLIDKYWDFAKQTPKKLSNVV